MNSERVFVTGATGLIGKQLVERLLERGCCVHILMRSERAREHSAKVQHWTDFAQRFNAKLEVVSGDVAIGGMGIDESGLKRLDVTKLDHAFHVAGYYEIDGEPSRLQAVNVDGTRNLLAFLHQNGFTGALHHVSSIAVMGDHAGDFTEEMFDVGQSQPTEYHRTKFESEKLVRKETNLRFRIYRPSAVVGHSKTGAMDRLDGAYYLFQMVHRVRDLLPRWIRLPGLDRTRINMVPCDFVAAAIDEIAHQAGHDGKTFHVVDAEAPRFFETFNLIADAAGASRMSRPKFRGASKWMPALQDVAGKLGSPRFIKEGVLRDAGIPPIFDKLLGIQTRLDATQLQAALAGTSVRCPNQREYVEPLWDFYVRNLDPNRDRIARDRKELSGKVVLITGGSSGIGEALARYMARVGAKVVIVARREEELVRVVKDIEAEGGAASYIVADLNDFEACDAAVATTLERHGTVDVLVNNAGRSIRRPLADSIERFHDIERVMRLNFLVPVRMIRGVLPVMRKNKSGVIANVLTAGAHMPSPRFGAYTTSKAALSQFGDTLMAESIHEGIRVTSSYPYWVRTPMMDATGKYDEVRAMTPEDCAHSIVDGIVLRRQHVIDGRTRFRFMVNRMIPTGLARVMNLVFRVYDDDPESFPELTTDRAVAKQFIKTRLI